MKLSLILVTGLPASGKSGFSRYASRELGLPMLEKDHFKEILFDDIGFESREEKMKLGVAAMDLMYDQAARLLEMGISVILDNNFESGSMPGLRALADRYGCKLVTVRFEDDIAAIHRRFVRRDMDPRRHRGHVLNTRYPEGEEREEYKPLSLEAFEEKCRSRGMLDFYPGGELIRVDVKGFRDYDQRLVLEKLRAALERE